MNGASRSLLAANLRCLRHSLGWSQEQLAEHCGLHRTYIGAIERGERNISLDTLERLAGALQLPVSALLDTITGHNRVREQPGTYLTSTTAFCSLYQAFCYS